MTSAVIPVQLVSLTRVFGGPKERLPTVRYALLLWRNTQQSSVRTLANRGLRIVCSLPTGRLELKLEGLGWRSLIMFASG